MSQTILVGSGAAEYTFPLTLTDTDGDNITADTVQVTLGSYELPTGSWATPDVETNPSTSSVTVRMLIGSSVASGTYWPWVKLAANPQVILRRSWTRLVIVNIPQPTLTVTSDGAGLWTIAGTGVVPIGTGLYSISENLITDSGEGAWTVESVS